MKLRVYVGMKLDKRVVVYQKFGFGMVLVVSSGVQTVEYVELRTVVPKHQTKCGTPGVEQCC